MFHNDSTVKIYYSVLGVSCFGRFRDLEAYTEQEEEVITIHKKFDQYARRNKNSRFAYALITVDQPNKTLEIVYEPKDGKWTYEAMMKQMLPLRKYYPEIKLLCAEKVYPEGYEEKYARAQKYYSNFMKKHNGQYIRKDRINQHKRKYVKHSI